MAVVLSRKHALELEVKWVHLCVSVCMCVHVWGAHGSEVIE